MSSKRNLKATIQKNGGVKQYVNSDLYEDMSDDELKDAIFNARRNQENDISVKMANDNKRNTLLRKAGFDYFDINELQPHPENAYSIDEESIKNLAGLIYKSKEIQPLVLQETPDGLRIIDGERRWRACKYLTELYGDSWRMVPAHCHALGTLSDEEAEFILHSNNFGQRRLSASEVALGFQVLADALVDWRKNDPSLKGVKTKTYLAEHFGVSERTAMTNLAIAKGLTDAGKELLDNGQLTKAQAEALAHLDEEKQNFITDAINDSDITNEEVTQLIEVLKTTDLDTLPEDNTSNGEVLPKLTKTKTAQSLLKNARNALKKATRHPGDVDPIMLAEIKKYIAELENRYNEQFYKSE